MPALRAPSGSASVYRVFEAKGRKHRSDKVSFTPEGPAVIVMHSVEEPEGGERSQSG